MPRKVNPEFDQIPHEVLGDDLDIESARKESDALKNKAREEDIVNQKQNRELRKKYAGKLFWMICVWLTLIIGILVFQGVRIIHLSNSVLITLITTTTANVAAFFLVVTKYLFPNK